MLLAISCRQNPQVRWLLREGEELPQDQAASTETVPDAINPLAHHRDPREVTLTGMLVQCKDERWIMHSLSEPHFFPAWIKAIGFDWIWDDERFQGAPWKFPDIDAKVELVERLQQRMKEKDSAEWIDCYIANGNVCADVIQTTQDALRHRQLLAIEGVIEIDDPRVGPMLQIGPLAKIPGAPAVGAARRRPSPVNTPTSSSPRAVTPVAVPPATRELPGGPLDGITIVEAGYYYATPFATALLAELGARVIKIEPIKGDPYRLLGRGGGDPVAALGHNNMVRAMQGKESIALNLKDERGREDHPSSRRRSRPLRAQLPRPGSRVPRHRRADAARDQARSRLPVRGLVRIGRAVRAAARDRPGDRRVRGPDRVPDRRGQSAPAGERRRPRRGGRSRRGDDARAVRARPHRRRAVRRVGDDRVEHLPELPGRLLVRRASRRGPPSIPASSESAQPIGSTNARRPTPPAPALATRIPIRAG